MASRDRPIRRHHTRPHTRPRHQTSSNVPARSHARSNGMHLPRPFFYHLHLLYPILTSHPPFPISRFPGLCRDRVGIGIGVVLGRIRLGEDHHPPSSGGRRRSGLGQREGLGMGWIGTRNHEEKQFVSMIREIGDAETRRQSTIRATFEARCAPARPPLLKLHTAVWSDNCPSSPTVIVHRLGVCPNACGAASRTLPASRQHHRTSPLPTPLLPSTCPILHYPSARSQLSNTNPHPSDPSSHF
jgi:hypothetical protein